MQRIVAIRLLILLLGALACGGSSTEPAQPTGLNGSFGLTSATPYWIGVTLHESGGVITGTGWASQTNALRHGATVTGTYNAPAVSLDLVPRVPGTTLHLTGTFVNDTLRVIGPRELARIKTAPTGVASIHLTGDVTADISPPAEFRTDLRSKDFVIRLEVTEPLDAHWGVFFDWIQIDLPRAGTYVLTDPLSPTSDELPGSALYNLDEPAEFGAYRLRSGTVTLEIAERWTMAGHFELIVTNPHTGKPVNVTGTFNTGCAGVIC